MACGWSCSTEAGQDAVSGPSTAAAIAAASVQRESPLLGLPDGAPVLEVLDVFADPTGRPIQYARSRYRPDRYEVWTSVQSTSTPRPDDHPQESSDPRSPP